MNISRRDRMALRADKWWRSVWLLQMLMEQRGGLKPLTDGGQGGILYGLKQIVVSDGPTVGFDHPLNPKENDYADH